LSDILMTPLLFIEIELYFITVDTELIRG